MAAYGPIGNNYMACISNGSGADEVTILFNHLKGAVSVFFRCHIYFLYLNHENIYNILLHRKGITPYKSADCKSFDGEQLETY